MKDRVRSNWTATIIVCGKCSRKLGGGFGDDRRGRFAKLLRRHFGGGKGRKAALGVVESGCLGICPKRALVAFDAARPHEWRIIPAGTDVADAAALLGATRSQ